MSSINFYNIMTTMTIYTCVITNYYYTCTYPLLRIIFIFYTCIRSYPAFSKKKLVPPGQYNVEKRGVFVEYEGARID